MSKPNNNRNKGYGAIWHTYWYLNGEERKGGNGRLCEVNEHIMINPSKGSLNVDLRCLKEIIELVGLQWGGISG